MIKFTGVYLDEFDFVIITKFRKRIFSEDEYRRADTVASKYGCDISFITQKELCNCFALEYGLDRIESEYMIVQTREFICNEG